MNLNTTDFLKKLFYSPGVTLLLNLERKHNILVHQAINSLVSNIHYDNSLKNYWNNFYYTNRWWNKSFSDNFSDEPQQMLGFFYQKRLESASINPKQQALIYKDKSLDNDELNYQENDAIQRKLDKQIGFNNLLYWSNNFSSFYKTYLAANASYFESNYLDNAQHVLNHIKATLKNNYFLQVPYENNLYSLSASAEINNFTSEESLIVNKQVDLLPPPPPLTNYALALGEAFRLNHLTFAQICALVDVIFDQKNESKFYTVSYSQLNAKGKDLIVKLGLNQYLLPEFFVLPEEYCNLKEDLEFFTFNFAQYKTTLASFRILGKEALLAGARELYPAISKIKIKLAKKRYGVYHVVSVVPFFGSDILNIGESVFCDQIGRLDVDQEIIDALDRIILESVDTSALSLLIEDPRSLEDVEYNIKLITSIDYRAPEYNPAYKGTIDILDTPFTIYPQVFSKALAKNILADFLPLSPCLEFLSKKFYFSDNRIEGLSEEFQVARRNLVPLENLPRVTNTNLYNEKDTDYLEDILAQVPEEYKDYVRKNIDKDDQLPIEAVNTNFPAKHRFDYEERHRSIKPIPYAKSLNDIDFLAKENRYSDLEDIVFTEVYKQNQIDVNNFLPINPYKGERKYKDIINLIKDARCKTISSFYLDLNQDLTYYDLVKIEEDYPDNNLIIAPYTVKVFVANNGGFINYEQLNYYHGLVYIDKPINETTSDNSEQIEVDRTSFLTVDKSIDYLVKRQNIHALEEVPTLSLKALDYYLNQRRYSRLDTPDQPLPEVIYIEDVVTFLIHSLPKSRCNYDFKLLKDYYHNLIEHNSYSKSQKDLIKLSIYEFNQEFEKFTQGINQIFQSLNSLANEFKIQIIMNFNLTSVLQAFGLTANDFWSGIEDSKLNFFKFTYSNDNYEELDELDNRELLHKTIIKDLSPNIVVEKDPQLYLTLLQNSNYDLTTLALVELVQEDYHYLLDVKSKLKVSLASQALNFFSEYKVDFKSFNFYYYPYSKKVEF
ncbi:hypothetical protein CKF54_02385 [Psittacicella hinzii]|uniref:Uncharacterized protein n=1 Tax=Psittacicella hinzii TaxID=2028575 RepID=A0A3A1YBZ8_9GAMM|nr:hypothetical protein [Psittacicella hinzii]RIY33744.1 hypothetical protein CKF54_02385 [Psittacicella hinzii]